MSRYSRSISTRQREAIFSASRGRCWYCGRKATTVDHLIPMSKGGPNAAPNRVPCCFDCNRDKGDRTLAEFRERRPKEFAHVRFGWTPFGALTSE